MRRLTCLTAFVVFISALLTSIGSVVEAQVPTLDPQKTVNVANGEMGFALPLGTVKGINGHDFPVNLNYKSGIRIHDEASSVGLGFSYDVGCVARQPIFIPDDFLQVNDDDYLHISYTPNCTPPLWKQAVNVLMQFVSFIVMIVSTCLGQFEGVGAAVAWEISVLWDVVELAVSNLLYSAKDYSAGGSHLPTYNYLTDNQKGFFKGGDATDMPDLYIVNTPIICGQLAWEGDVQNGYFVFKETRGSALKTATSDTRTIKVEYDKTNSSYFKIWLKDGTELVFDDIESYPMHSANFGGKEDGDNRCSFNYQFSYRKPVIAKWNLTRIIYPDYIDGNGDDLPDNSLSTNKGSWISFKYKHIIEKGLFYTTFPVFNYGTQNQYSLFGFQSSPWSVSWNVIGDYFEENQGFICINGAGQIFKWNFTSPYPVTLCFLEDIITPNETAHFTLENSRVDNYWLKKNGTSTDIYPMPLLKDVIFQTKSGVKSTIKFITDYTLRSGSITSYNYIPNLTPNTKEACLTLKKIDIYNADDKYSSSVNFTYNKNLDISYRYGPQIFVNDDLCVDYFRILGENRDLWGFFNTKIGDNSSWNIDGDPSRTIDEDAWSLSKIDFSNGTSIQWDYEPHRYTYTNGVPAKLENNITPIAKFGGGIRVKTMTVNNGLNQNQAFSYFYTNMDDVFSEHNTEAGNVDNSSGYASLEPFPYILENDSRPILARGGFYTPSKVAYEKVKVVENYQVTEPHAPLGYTVYDFTHAGNKNISGFYPNGGTYGEIDSSWKRGLLKSVSVFNNNNKRISRTEIDYKFYDQTDLQFNLKCDPFLDLLDTAQIQNSIGWALPVAKTETVNAIARRTEYKYAVDLDGTKDKTGKDITSVVRTDPWGDDVGLDLYCYPHNESAFCIGTVTGAGDPLYEDHIFCNANSGGLLNIVVVSDFRKSLESSETWKQRTHTGSFVNIYDHILGIGLVDIDQGGNGPKNDLLVVYYDQYYTQIGCYVLKNIRIEGNIVRFDNPIKSNLPMIDPTIVPYGCQLTSCAIGEISNPKNNKPDFLFIYNELNDPDKEASRYLIGYQDFDVNSNTSPYYKSASYTFPGHAARLVKNNATGNMDVEVTGLNDYVSNRANVCRRFFRNIAFGASNQLTVSSEGVVSCPTPFTFSVNFQDQSRYLVGLDYSEYPTKKDVYSILVRVHRSGGGPDATDLLTLFSISPSKIEGDLDGRPNQIWETNSDGKKRITTPIPAYWKYPAMGDPVVTDNKHMLTQTCQTIIYEKAKTDIPTDLPATQARASQVTAWNNLPSNNGIWLPCSTYTWFVPKDASGIPISGIGTFNFASAGSNDGTWKFNGGVSKYNSFSMPIENTAPLGAGKTKYNTTVYRLPFQAPTGSISNAQFHESGVFTCEYGSADNTNTYCDIANGWEFFNSTISNAYAHFGQRCTQVQNGGWLGRNFKVAGSTKYRFTVWVRVEKTSDAEGNAQIVAENWTGPALVATFPIVLGGSGTTHGTDISSGAQGNTNGNWVLMNLEFTTPSGIGNYIRAKIQNIGTANVYVDDIRFAPANAQVSTTYYDQLWQQPILSVGPDNNPGRLVEYDNFGRPNLTYKVNKTTGELSVTNVQSYHLMKETPLFDAKTYSTKWYKIIPKLNTDNTIGLDIQNGYSGIGQHFNLQLYTLAVQQEQNNQLWQFVSNPDGTYSIKSKAAGVSPNPAGPYYVDDPYGAIADGTPLQMWNDLSNNQKWSITPLRDGCFRIACKAHGGKVMQYNGTIGSGIAVQLGAYKNTDNQKWKIVEVP